ncbi:MAG: hypothetical protein JW864_12250 [Spirochaetes bacterium]|nr:hypothetical protein [Spirochaetota bacterium]
MIKRNIFLYVSYFNILYFLEIINLMFLLLVSYGKFIAIAAGFIFSLFLSVQIVFLYFKNELSRKIQLFLMDVHAGYSIPFLFFIVFYYIDNSIYDNVITGLRFVMICAEIFFIILLSDYSPSILNTQDHAGNGHPDSC